MEMLAALGPLTPSPPFKLNTVLILPDGNEKILRRMFERSDEVAKAVQYPMTPRTLSRRVRGHPGRQVR